jgi:hypothetical protein
MSHTFSKAAAPLALVAAFALIASPSSGQERERGRRQRSGQESSGRAAERAQPRAQQPAQEPPRAEAPARAPQTQAQAQPNRPAEGQRDRAQGSRANAGQDNRARAVPRQEAIAPRGNVDRRDADGRARDAYSSRGYSSRGYAAPRYESRYRYSTRYGSGVRSYYRPYVFRPRLSIGLGIFVGYPAPYAYRYSSPIYVYGYRAPRAPVMIGPGSPYYGGVVLEMSPFDADVYVDGSYAGRVEDFDGSQQPLTLVAGVHRIEVQAAGFAPFMVDVDVQPGQIIPYRGDLQPY